jgi:hypothetical protein
MSLMQATRIEKSSGHKLLHKKRQSRTDAPDRPDRASKTHYKATSFPEQQQFVN